MRELKFRAWDKASKKMHYDIRAGGFKETVPTIYIKNIGWVHLFASNDGNEGCVMQFTGLKDKNGKDLDWWEDDLLRKGSDHPNAPIGRIRYREQQAMWVIVSKANFQFCRLEVAYMNNWKKIGNIHESP